MLVSNNTIKDDARDAMAAQSDEAIMQMAEDIFDTLNMAALQPSDTPIEVQGKKYLTVGDLAHAIKLGLRGRLNFVEVMCVLCQRHRACTRGPEGYFVCDGFCKRIHDEVSSNQTWAKKSPLEQVKEMENWFKQYACTNNSCPNEAGKIPGPKGRLCDPCGEKYTASLPAGEVSAPAAAAVAARKAESEALAIRIAEWELMEAARESAAAARKADRESAAARKAAAAAARKAEREAAAAAKEAEREAAAAAKEAERRSAAGAKKSSRRAKPTKRLKVPVLHPAFHKPLLARSSQNPASGSSSTTGSVSGSSFTSGFVSGSSFTSGFVSGLSFPSGFVSGYPGPPESSEGCAPGPFSTSSSNGLVCPSYISIPQSPVSSVDRSNLDGGALLHLHPPPSSGVLSVVGTNPKRPWSLDKENYSPLPNKRQKSGL